MDTTAPRPHVPTHLLPYALVADEDAGGEAAEFVLPEDLTDGEAVPDEELARLEAEATEAFDRISGQDNVGPAELATCTALAEAIQAIQAEAGRRMEAATEVRNGIDALRSQVHGDDENGEGGEGEGDEGTSGDDDEGGEGGEGTGDGSGGGGTGEGADTDPELVTAGAGGAPRPLPRRIPLGRIHDRAQAPPIPDPDGAPLVITAAGDIPRIARGAALDGADGIGRAAHARAAHLADGQSAIVASVELPADITIGETATAREMEEAIRSLTDQDAQDGLIAAGGWCAPNDRIWTQFGIESATAGLMDDPTMRIERGGLDFPVSPSLADVFTAEGITWEWTEADDIAALGNPHVDPLDDVTKPCFRIPCGTWDDVRLTNLGVCVTHGNLSARAYPEQTDRFVELILAAHAHRVNAIRIARKVALSQAVTIAATAGALAPLLNAVDLQAHDYRDKFRMDPNAVLEAVFPMWVTGLVRADLARRSGVDPRDVSEAEVRGWFTERQVAPQFVYDWQSLQLGAAGADGFRETWPAQVQFLLYAAGTFVRGIGPTLDLGVQRDSAQNAQNDHTLMWSEEADLTAMVGHESRLVTVPVVPNGATSAPVVPPAGPLA